MLILFFNNCTILSKASSLESYPMEVKITFQVWIIDPITPTWTGGYVGVTSTPGWPDARPEGDFDSNMSQSSHPYFGSYSGSSYHTSLSSSSQYGMGLPVDMLFQSQTQPCCSSSTCWYASLLLSLLAVWLGFHNLPSVKTTILIIFKVPKNLVKL